MSTYSLPLNNSGLVLLAINGSLVNTPPVGSINTENIISVKAGALIINGSKVNTVRVTYKGTNINPDTYDFATSGQQSATATAGFTIGSVTAGDKVLIQINGVNYEYTTVSGDTAATIKAAMLALLVANTSGFSVSVTGTTTVLYTLTAPAGSTSSWNGFVVNTTFPTNAGPTFSSAVHTNFSNGVGTAEQFQAFLTAQSISSPLVSFTGLEIDGDNNVKNGPSFMLNQFWVISKTYDGSANTNIIYDSPLLLPTSYVVAGNQSI